MYCPRCGTPNEQGDRYCSSCGAGLGAASEPKEKLSSRDRLERIVGTTRKARLLTLGTFLALVVAIAAFFALKADEEETIPRDSYTIAADRLCLGAKGEIVAAERRFVQQGGKGGPGGLTSELVPIVASWRSEFEAIEVPPDRVRQAQDLEAALLEAEAQLGGLARAAVSGGNKEVLASAKRADEASAGVEGAVAALGLSRCAAATIEFLPSSS